MGEFDGPLEVFVARARMITDELAVLDHTARFRSRSRSALDRNVWDRKGLNVATGLRVANHRGSSTHLGMLRGERRCDAVPPS